MLKAVKFDFDGVIMATEQIHNLARINMLKNWLIHRKHKHKRHTNKVI